MKQVDNQVDISANKD